MATSLLWTKAEWLLNRPGAWMGQDAMANSPELSTFSPLSGISEGGRQARLTLRQAFTGSLATLDIDGDYPFASLVTVASCAAGDPILLLSGLARHSKNLAQNTKASLLVEAPVSNGDPLAGARVSVQGAVEQTSGTEARARFLTRHPEAKGYADFADFAFYKLHVVRAHFIAGFGRIQSFSRAQFCLAGSAVSLAVDKETRNAWSNDRQSALNRAWRLCVGATPAYPVEIIGSDADGLEVRSGEAQQRLNFSSVVDGEDAISDALKALEAPQKSA